MSWQPIDCHAHTTLSDGRLAPDTLVRTVRARGVRPSISDHLSGDLRYAIRTIEGVRDYLDSIEPLDVARGGEFCWHDTLWRELPDDLAARFTHRIGSLHAVLLPGGDALSVFERDVPEGLTPEAYMAIHVDNLERFAREMPVDILAHPTLIPLPWRKRAPEEMWTEALEERAVQALARAGKAFEVSARYRPHRRIVARAHAAGVMLSLGSDGHTAEQVGDLTFPLSLVRELGVRDDQLFDPLAR